MSPTVFAVFCVLVAVHNANGAVYTPSNLVVNVISSTVLVINWDADPTDTGGATTGYRIYMDRLDNRGTTNWVPANVEQLVRQYTISGVGIYGEYNVSVLAVSADGDGPKVSSVVQTLAEEPGRGPQNITGVPDYYWIAVEWESVDPSYSYGTITGWQISYELAYHGDPTTFSAASNVMTANITGLIPNKWYIIQVAGINAIGVGLTSSTWVLTLGGTLEPATAAPEDSIPCYNLLPPTLVFDWVEMPCWIYFIIICSLFFFCLLFGVAMCAMCCKTPAGGKGDSPVVVVQSTPAQQNWGMIRQGINNKTIHQSIAEEDDQGILPGGVEEEIIDENNELPGENTELGRESTKLTRQNTKMGDDGILQVAVDEESIVVETEDKINSSRQSLTSARKKSSVSPAPQDLTEIV
ncbi:unnamed protein product [Owenia fusiformis]|uniref:Fibronectin type-III domain-containing protein n=1 Tax=Owenia fusiformis TaxID=6347 RepID=A0A8S4Q4G5_OWEFU|nr:unnamed protein product [Owenia fusiformis]